MKNRTGQNNAASPLPDAGLSSAMQKRLMAVGIFLCCVAVPFLLINIIRIQFFAEHNGKSYAELALDNQLSDTAVPAVRGLIYDRNFKVLAQNSTVWTIEMYPSAIKELEEDRPKKAEEIRGQIADSLSEILGMDRDRIYETACRSSSYVCIKKNVDKETAGRVSAFIKEKKLGCLAAVPAASRYYPYGSFASSVIGFTGDSNQGLAGAEYYYERLLRGADGRSIGLKNGRNDDMPSDFERNIEPENGSSLRLTIDEVVQHYLEKHLKQAQEDNRVAKRAAGIVMDVDTGEILGMATVGGYDLNKPFEIADEKVRKELEAEDPENYGEALKQARYAQWKDKVIGEVYEPGSVFKIITAAMALEEDVVSPTEKFVCKGSLKVADRVIYCWKRDGSHGSETFAQGLQNSCNPVFMTVAARLGPAKFMKYFEAFGFTRTTGIDLPGEDSGVAHDAATMGAVELASSSFGQTFKVTPLQMITAVSAVANGGNLMTPHIVKSIADSEGRVIRDIEPRVRRQVISEQTSRAMREMLESVVSRGTGRNAYVAGYRVAGKTGTSEKIDASGASGKDAVIASFCGFAPAEAPRYAVLVVLDEPHNPRSNQGGLIAAPVVGRIFEDILPYLGVEAVYTDAELENLSVTVPDITGKKEAAAESELRSRSLALTTAGSGGRVVRQIPEAGSPMPKKGTVVAVMSEDAEVKTVKVPRLLGGSLGSAESKMSETGLNLLIKGARAGVSEASVGEQFPAAGETVPVGTVVEIRLEYEDRVD